MVAMILLLPRFVSGSCGACVSVYIRVRVVLAFWVHVVYTWIVDSFVCLSCWIIEIAVPIASVDW